MIITLPTICIVDLRSGYVYAGKSPSLKRRPRHSLPCKTLPHGPASRLILGNTLRLTSRHPWTTTLLALVNLIALVNITGHSPDNGAIANVTRASPSQRQRQRCQARSADCSPPTYRMAHLSMLPAVLWKGRLGGVVEAQRRCNRWVTCWRHSLALTPRWSGRVQCLVCKPSTI